MRGSSTAHFPGLKHFAGHQFDPAEYQTETNLVYDSLQDVKLLPANPDKFVESNLSAKFLKQVPENMK